MPDQLGSGRLGSFPAYVVATAATAVTLGVRLALDERLGGQPTLVIFTLPIMLSAYLGGLGAGLLATGLSYLAASYYLLPPIHSLAIASGVERWQQFFVALTGVVISVLNEGFHRARRQADLAINAQQQAVRSLAESQEMLRLTLEIAQIGHWNLDLATMTATCSAEMSRMLHRDPAAGVLPFAEFLSMVHPGDRRLVEHTMGSSSAATAPHTFAYRTDPARGPIRHLSATSEVIRDASGRAVRTAGTALDVTRDRQAEIDSTRLAAIVESSDDAIISKDLNSIILSWNSSAERMFGYAAAEVVGTPIMRLIPDDRRQEETAIIDRIKRGERVEHFETLRRAKDGSPINVSITASPIRNAAGRVIGVSNTARDVTDRVRVDQALRESTSKLNGIFRAAPMGIGVAANRVLIEVNDFMCQMVGYSHAELVGREARFLYPTDEDYASAGREFRQLVARGPASTETRYRRKDGTIIDVAVTAAQVDPDNPAAGVVFAVMDITGRKEAEERLRQSMVELHAVSTRLNGIREQERARMARDIHDHLGQSLTALKMDVAEVRRRLKAADASAVEERLTEMSVLIDESVNDIRRVAAELRPPILDGLGVVAAIRAYLQDFGRRVNMPCILTTDLPEVTLADDRAIALFRILQEALTNVVRHAAAGRIDVALRVESGVVRLIVHDDGLGIPVEETRDPRALGLVGMRDRARLFGGDVAVSGRPGEGTTVTAFLPLVETIL